MNSKNDIRALIQEWVSRDGEINVERILLDCAIPPSTRMRLLRGYYPSEPKGLLRATLEAELKKAGFLEEAS